MKNFRIILLVISMLFGLATIVTCVMYLLNHNSINFFVPISLFIIQQSLKTYSNYIKKKLSIHIGVNQTINQNF